MADLYEPGFYNKNANDPTKWTVEEDPSRRIIAPRRFQVYMGRFTWQASPRNKIGFTYEQENLCFCPDDVGPEAAPDPFTYPEAGNDRRFPLQRFLQVDWNTPVSNRLLVEASAIHRVERWGDMAIQTGHDGGLKSIDQRMISVIDAATNRMYRLNSELNNSWNKNLHYRAAVSYITGSHAFKVGFNNAWGYHDNKTFSPESLIPGVGLVQGVQYQFTNGVPTALVLRSHPRTAKVEVDNDLGLFVQDKWTTGRWTLAGGLRYDWYQNSFPEQSFGGTNFPRISNLSWNDLTPKLGATWDVMGDGRTAVKVTLNKYLIGLGTLGLFDNAITSGPAPVNRLRTTTNRVWTDADGDFVPDCNIFAVAGQRRVRRAGRPLLQHRTRGERLRPGSADGMEQAELQLGIFGRRPARARSAGLARRLLLPPVVRQLPGLGRPCDHGGGLRPGSHHGAHRSPSAETAAGTRLSVYDLKPGAAPLSNINYLAPDGAKSETWQGLDVTGNVRLQNGLTLQGGVSGGYRVRDDCELAATSPEILHEFIWLGPTRGFFFAARPLELCRREDPWQTQVKALGAYVIPKIDVQLSATFQSLPGPIVEANYNSFSSGDLGRPWSIGPFRTIQIIPNGEVTGDRLNQTDFRVAKIFRVGQHAHAGELRLLQHLQRQPRDTREPRLRGVGAWRRTRGERSASGAVLQDRRAV